MEMWTKEAIRRQIAEKRRQLGENPKLEKAKNQILQEKARRLKIVQEAEAIFLYASIRHEADTWELARLWLKQGKRLAFPKVHGKEMSFYWVSSLDDLEVGCMKILEPKPDCEKAEGERAEKAPMLVPGVAFDWKGARIGYGGGYYDRFLAEHTKHEKIGYAFDFQMFETVPMDAYDCRMDRILTEIDR
ncbi:MAG: 5-formyltetrahydrofolate cyclo-ligase [bacterium]|nr:5-formyltetrahydrofolate cyclo-ligase [bacterium]